MRRKVSVFLASAGAAVVAVVSMTSQGFGSSVANIETQPSGTAVSFGTNTDPAAVITYIASQAGTTSDGYTYTNWAFLVNDGTGSLETFGHMPSSSTYVPTVGDAITASGTYSPFNSIPEVGSLTAITQDSTGNSVAGPITATVPQINALGSSLNYNILEYLVTLDNVTITQQNASNPVPGNFPTHANGTYTINDASGNTLTMFQYASSYSVSGLLGGTPVPTGTVDVTGIADVFSGTSEFIPFSFTSVPEPASLGLLSILGGAAMFRRRRA